MENSHIGETHGILKIVNLSDQKDSSGHKLYNVKCTICGGIFVYRYVEIKGYKNKPPATRCSHRNTRWEVRRIEHLFNQIIQRCYNSENKAYKWYGAKGIKICDEWLNDPTSFEEWALNNGYNDNLTIDRIDSNKNYCPENCCWISLTENSRKSGKVNWITVNNTTLTGKQWAKELNIGTNTINKSIRENGSDKTIALIKAMLKDPPINKKRRFNQTWLDVYGIE